MFLVLFVAFYPFGCAFAKKKIKEQKQKNANEIINLWHAAQFVCMYFNLIFFGLQGKQAQKLNILLIFWEE